jgi:UDP-3-O-acyl N-acetylglucosamine deacetylase
VRRLGQRPQRTLASPVTLFGRGLLKGQRVRIRFRPAAPDTGLVFVRTDLRPAVAVAATWDNVSGTRRRTTIGDPPFQVSLVEHVLAALAGLRIDNCQIELDAAEPPGLDGSAMPYVEALRDAGATLQSAARDIWTVNEPITVCQGRAALTIHPADADVLRVSYLLDYGPDSPIIRQKHTLDVTPESFRRELAHCRTFVLDHEAGDLMAEGVGRHITPAEILVFGPDGPIDNRLRHANEPARHKILDVIGDLALFGRDVRGHVVACRSGHPLNVELVRGLAAQLPEGRHRLRLFRAA